MSENAENLPVKAGDLEYSGSGYGRVYSEKYRSYFGTLLAQGLPIGSIRSALRTEFGAAASVRTIKTWKKELTDGAKESGRLSDKARRLSEYLNTLDEVAIHNAETIEDLIQENENRGGVGKMSKSLDDAEYLDFQQKSFNLIHRQAVEGVKLFSDEHGNEQHPFVLAVLNQPSEPPNGDSRTITVEATVIDDKDE